MIRIYLTENGIEGYNEGCSCCSSTENASSEDIQVLIDDTSRQIKDLRELKFILSKYGEENLSSWKKQAEKIKYLKERLEYAERYKQNKNAQGTYHGDCYKTRENDAILLDESIKIFHSVPSRFKKYIGFSE